MLQVTIPNDQRYENTNTSRFGKKKLQLSIGKHVTHVAMLSVIILLTTASVNMVNNRLSVILLHELTIASFDT